MLFYFVFIYASWMCISGQEFRNRWLNNVHKQQQQQQIQVHLSLSLSNCSNSKPNQTFRNRSILTSLSFFFFFYFLFSREATPLSSLCVHSDQMDSPAATKNHPPAKMPPKEEIDDFFAFAEKREQKRFAEKWVTLALSHFLCFLEKRREGAQDKRVHYRSTF